MCTIQLAPVTRMPAAITRRDTYYSIRGYPLIILMLSTRRHGRPALSHVLVCTVSSYSLLRSVTLTPQITPFAHVIQQLTVVTSLKSKRNKMFH